MQQTSWLPINSVAICNRAKEMLFTQKFKVPCPIWKWRSNESAIFTKQRRDEHRSWRCSKRKKRNCHYKFFNKYCLKKQITVIFLKVIQSLSKRKRLQSKKKTPKEWCSFSVKISHLKQWQQIIPSNSSSICHEKMTENSVDDGTDGEQTAVRAQSEVFLGVISIIPSRRTN